MWPRFTFRGIVERFGDWQINIRMDNGEVWRPFALLHGYRRNIDWAQTLQPLCTVSKQRLVSRCRPGDYVEYDVELRPRADGLIAWGLDLRVVDAN